MAFNKSYYHSNLGIKDKILALDFQLIFYILLLGMLSFLVMFSIDGGKFGYYTVNHIVRFFVFFLLFIFLSLSKINIWHKSAYLIYALVLFLLVFVDLFGITLSGSKRWLNLFVINIQPSEIMKFALLLFLARYYNRIPSHEVNSIKYLIQPLIAIIIPMGLIIRQPDLGTALLIAGGSVAIIYLAGMKLKYFIYSMFFLVITAPVVISFLKPYQKKRILTFLDPERDPLGSGYQIIQSKIAVGSGGIFGKGFLKGSQSYLDYLPEKHTDFVYTLFSEEFGFLGSSVLLILYVLIIFRIIAAGNVSRNSFAKLYCYGFATAFFIYVIVNMSMVLGMLPIVGAPLPIMSYGGSAMLGIMLGLGVVMSCRVHKNEVIS
tara:strand:- start:287 stop:1414 length:1128 start_codon:yes stop_codon:yes gene_type:complete